MLSNKNKVVDEERIIFKNQRNRDAKGSLKPSTSSDSPSGFSFDCFVATACYGPNDHITNSLRVWRDEIYKKGTEKYKLLFIQAYYLFIGKVGARILQTLPFLKPLARKLIKYFIRINKIPINK